MSELRDAALQALRQTSIESRLAAVRALGHGTTPCSVDAVIVDPGDVPGRPARPQLVAPTRLPARPIGTLEGRAALLHALAHIEFNAIGLALDHVWRFAGLPEAYYRDWTKVALEEASHFCLLRERLREAGQDYGDFPAHDGLWDMARKTAGDALSRMALVPRTLEARGLDASPAVRAKFVAVGDQASARVIDMILYDEVGHVAVGNRWFRWLCEQRALEPMAIYRELARRFGAPPLRGPLNLAARERAGFTAEELAELQQGR